MKTRSVCAFLLLGATFLFLLIPMQAEASQCSTAGEKGNWAYTCAGTIFTANGPLPAEHAAYVLNEQKPQMYLECSPD